jgi:hypothetical protein
VLHLFSIASAANAARLAQPPAPPRMYLPAAAAR